MRFTYGIGTTYRANGTIIPEKTRVIRQRLSLEIVCKVFGGAFVSNGHGAWLDDKNNLLVESSIQIDADTPASNVSAGVWIEQAAEVAKQLAALWEQTAVQFTQSIATSRLVRA